MVRSRHAGQTPAAVMILVFGLAGEVFGQSDPAASIPRAEFEALFARVDNAGRWGDDDERGTLNLVTDEVRRAAGSEVREGVSISLAREILSGPVPGAIEPAGIEFIQASDSLLGPSDGSARWTVDRITVVYHGLSFTHVDAPSHITYRGRGYNTPVAAYSADLEPERNTVGSMRDGFFTRGVLIDLPRLRGVAYAEPGSVVTTADLEAWERETGVRVRSGDVVLLRSGRWGAEAAAAGVARSAGLHPQAAEWLHERGVAAVGDEGGTDLPVSVVSGITAPFHVLALVAMGMPLFENLDLERLAEEAAARSRWTFLFVAGPLTLHRATGSPVNPIAVF